MRGLVLLLALLLGACTLPVTPTSMNDYYDTRTCCGVGPSLYGPTPGSVLIIR